MVVVGIIGIVIGAIWFISSFAVDIQSAPQQTVQYLGFVCGSIFLFGGIILLKISSFTKDVMVNIGNIYEKIQNIDENIEIIYKDKIFDKSDDSPDE